jgi:hypothetical protein
LPRSASPRFIAIGGRADFGPSEVHILAQAPEKWKLLGGAENRAQGLLFGTAE